jgi:hypothetical protein
MVNWLQDDRNEKRDNRKEKSWNSLDRIYRPALALSIQLSSIDILSKDMIFNIIIFNARSGPGIDMIFFTFPACPE